MSILEENFYDNFCENLREENNKKEIISLLISLNVNVGTKNMTKLELCKILRNTIDEFKKKNYLNISSKFIWEEIGISKEELANLMLMFKEEKESMGLIKAILVVKNYIFGNYSIINPKTYYKIILLLFSLVSGKEIEKDRYKYYGENFVGKIFDFFGIANSITNVTINFDSKISNDLLKFMDNKKVSYINICDKKHYVSLKKANIVLGILENALAIKKPNINGVNAFEEASKSFILQYYLDRDNINYEILRVANMFGKISAFLNSNVYKNLSKVSENIPLKNIKCFDCQIGNDFNVKASLYIIGKVNGLETTKLVVVKKKLEYYVVHGVEIFYILSFCKEDLSINCEVIDFDESNTIADINHSRIIQESTAIAKNYKLNLSKDVFEFLSTLYEDKIYYRIKELKNNYLKFITGSEISFKNYLPVIDFREEDLINNDNLGVYKYIKENDDNGIRFISSVLVTADIYQINKKYMQASRIAFPSNFFSKNSKRIRDQTKKLLLEKDNLNDKYVIVTSMNSGIITSHLPITNAVKIFIIREMFPEYFLNIYELVINGDFERNVSLINFINKVK